MSFTVPVAAAGALVLLSLAAREWKYEMTSVSLLVLAGVLVAWFGTVLWLFG